MDINFPYRLSPQGATAVAPSRDDHIAQMLEQLLFTRPGERVNRPDFGCGLLDLIFSPTSPEVAAALTITVTGAVQKWLGDVVQITSVDVTSVASTLQVMLSYLVVATASPATLTLSVPVA